MYWDYPDYLFNTCATSTAHATVQSTIGLLPIPITLFIHRTYIVGMEKFHLTEK